MGGVGPSVLGTQRKFAIRQPALLFCTPEANILWDCISLIDDATITLIFNGLGGLHAIAISHPPGILIADTGR
jgi:hypothetical protein